MKDTCGAKYIYIYNQLDAHNGMQHTTQFREMDQMQCRKRRDDPLLSRLSLIKRLKITRLFVLYQLLVYLTPEAFSLKNFSLVSFISVNT